MPNTKLAGHLGRMELIVLVAALIAINAFAIDVMLPGLQQIGESLGEADPNRRQLVIPAYMLGFGLLQIVFGPLSDSYGRRRPLLAGLLAYGLAALSAFWVTDFDQLLVLRMVQGAGAAASMVIGMALVRDLFVGAEMAKIMSLVFMVLMVSPILAPGFGQFLLTVMDWQGLFAFMAAVGLLVFVWVIARLPETLPPEERRPFTPRSVIAGFGIVFGNRVALAYIMGAALLFGVLIGFLNSSQQLYVEHFGMGAWFPVFFGAGGAVAAVGGFINSNLVGKFGMAPIANRALAVFFLAGAAMLALASAGWLTVWLFFGLSAVLFFCFSMIMPNFGALAMEPLGEVAGTAASAQGFLQMVLGATLGTVIGLSYNGTAIPFAMGAILFTGSAGLWLWLVTRGRAPEPEVEAAE